MDLGLLLGGVEIQQSFEIDAKCCATQRANFAHQVVECDMRLKLVKDQLPADIYAATYPCTKYSGAANLHGTCTGDDLYLHFFRQVAIDLPEMYLLENVPGMKKFPVVMEAMTRLPGYYVHVICPVSTANWLPQRRDRLIIIGSKRFFLWREPEPGRRVALRDILESDPQIEIPDYVASRLDGAYRDQPIISDPERDDIAPTCVAHYAKDLSTRLVRDRRFPRGVRPYTVREYARLQGVPDTFVFTGSDRDAYRMIGNGVSVPVGEWFGNEACRYFNARRAAA